MAAYMPEINLARHLEQGKVQNTQLPVISSFAAITINFCEQKKGMEMSGAV